MSWVGGSNVALAAPNFTSVNGTFKPVFTNGANSLVVAPSPPVASTSLMLEAVISHSLTTSGLLTLSLGTTGVFPTASTLDIFITEIDNAAAVP
jgi:hypothetical protein